MSRAAPLPRRLRHATLAQAARVAEARAEGGEVGRDAYPEEEAVRFHASDRMMLVADDLAEVEERQGRTSITANLLGLAGASPALPMPYSELQLRRRRLRDFGFARFLNLFDHRALSFFYRIVRKYSWPLLAERAKDDRPDPVSGLLTALAGLGLPGVLKRLDTVDATLAPLVPHLSDLRRSAASVEAVLRALTGLPLRVVEGAPVWMVVPRAEQSRLGGLGAQAAQLGGDSAALIGAAVLDVQHHYVVELGPVSYRQLQRFCKGREARRLVTQLCALAAGIEHRPSIRLLIAAEEIPPLRLGDDDAPAMLGWTSWLGAPAAAGLVGDCVLPIDSAAIR